MPALTRESEGKQVRVPKDEAKSHGLATNYVVQLSGGRANYMAPLSGARHRQILGIDETQSISTFLQYGNAALSSLVRFNDIKPERVSRHL